MVAPRKATCSAVQSSISSVEVFTPCGQNMVVILADHNVLNKEGTIIDINVDYRQGKAYLLRDGMVFKICWSTLNEDYPNESNRFRPILFTNCAGEIVNLATGSTWINIMDSNAEVWHLESALLCPDLFTVNNDK